MTSFLSRVRLVLVAFVVLPFSGTARADVAPGNGDGKHTTLTQFVLVGLDAHKDLRFIVYPRCTNCSNALEAKEGVPFTVESQVKGVPESPRIYAVKPPLPDIDNSDEVKALLASRKVGTSDLDLTTQNTRVPMSDPVYVTHKAYRVQKVEGKLELVLVRTTRIGTPGGGRALLGISGSSPGRIPDLLTVLGSTGPEAAVGPPPGSTYTMTYWRSYKSLLASDAGVVSPFVAAAPAPPAASSGVAPAPDGGAAPPTHRKNNCGCSVVGGAGNGLAWVALLIAGAVLAASRRRS